MLSAQSLNYIDSFGVVHRTCMEPEAMAVDRPEIALCHGSPVNRQISIVGAQTEKEI